MRELLTGDFSLQLFLNLRQYFYSILVFAVCEILFSLLLVTTIPPNDQIGPFLTLRKCPHVRSSIKV